MRPILIGSLLLLPLATPFPAAALPWHEEGGAVAVAVRRMEESPQIRAVLTILVSDILADAALLDALRQASHENDGISIDTIIQRDIAWRLQAKRGSGPLVSPVMGGIVSQHLALLRFPRQTLLADLMLTDDRGLLVGATRIPTDYDQSDEAKYIIPSTTAPGTLHVEDAAYDESADDYVVVASIQVIDPVDGRPLGVLCANFILAALQKGAGASGPP